VAYHDTKARGLKLVVRPSGFKALSEEPNITVRDYILLSLLTGARKANMLAMRWDELNLEQAVWRIPETKNGEAHSIPSYRRLYRARNKSLEVTLISSIFLKRALYFQHHMSKITQSFLR